MVFCLELSSVHMIYGYPLLFQSNLVFLVSLNRQEFIYVRTINIELPYNFCKFHIGFTHNAKNKMMTLVSSLHSSVLVFRFDILTIPAVNINIDPHIYCM